jgi:hypothetical protein
MINLNLTIDECNVILRSLGKGSFDEVAGLVSKIKAQGDAQIADMEKQAAAEAAANPAVVTDVPTE